MAHHDDYPDVGRIDGRVIELGRAATEVRPISRRGLTGGLWWPGDARSYAAPMRARRIVRRWIEWATGGRHRRGLREPDADDRAQPLGNRRPAPGRAELGADPTATATPASPTPTRPRV